MVIQIDLDAEQKSKDDKSWNIYMHKCPNGKVYIGRTTKRLKVRSGRNGSYYKPNKEFFNDICTFGWDNFEHYILDSCKEEKESMDLEIKYIAEYESVNPQKGYNKSIGGYPCNKGRTEEDRKRIQNECARRWKENNYERYLENRKKIDHSEKTHARKNAWNKTPERRKKRTEYMRKYREANRERIREIDRKSAKKRRERLAENNSMRYSPKDE